jgi:hypothetical protein
MAERPGWMDYADLASKWMVPIAVLGATAWLTAHSSAQQEKDTRLRACIDKQFQLADFACKNANCASLTDAQGAQLVHLTKAVASVCDGTNFTITQGVQDQVKSASASTNDVRLTAQVADALGAQPHVITVSGPDMHNSGSFKVGTYASHSFSGNNRPLLYVQISEDSQRAGAADLIKRLDQVTFRGATLNAQGPDLKPINQTQLRCLTRSDCQSASELASFVSALLGVSVPVVDLSARYDRPAPRPYELWIAPGQLQVATRTGQAG